MIPEDAIRIRIIANSDSTFDQQVKQDLRDQVAGMIVAWGAMPATHDEARVLIASHLTEIQALADRVLDEWEVEYSADVTLAEVPFPEKVFGGREYAAGDYEALRIMLGDGQGANWWCVLFPPLCLTAATAAEEPAQQSRAAATVAKAGAKDAAGLGKAQGKSVSKVSANEKNAGAAPANLDDSQEDSDKPKARFFLWTLLEKLGAFLSSLFA